MKKRRVRKLWESLKLKEQKRFGHWLAFRGGEEAEILISLQQAMEESADDELIWQKLYPEIPYKKEEHYDRLRKLFNRLSVQIEDYLACNALLADEGNREVYLLKEINHRDTNAEELFAPTYNKAVKRQERNPVRDESYFRSRYLLEQEKQHFLGKHPPKGLAFGIESFFYFFEQWVVAKIIYINIVKVNFQKVMGPRFSTYLLDSLVEEIGPRLPKGGEAIAKQYWDVYQLLATNQNNVNKLIHNFTDNVEVFRLDMQKNIFFTFLNYLTRLMHTDSNNETLRSIIHLSEIGIERKWFFVDNQISISNYKNIIIRYLRYGDKEKAFKYLHSLKPYLPKEQREEVFQFNLAHYYYVNHELIEVVNLLNKNPFTNVYYAIQGRLYLFQAYYELDWDIDLENYLRSLRLFILSQKKISDLQKNSYANRIKLMSKFLKAYTPKELVALREEVYNTKPLDNSEWLIQKIKDTLIQED